MRVISMRAFGGPETLELVARPTPAIDAATALVRIEAASINPSDVKNVAGAMSQTILPRVPGRDYAGVVEIGPDEWVGAEVWGTGGDVGFTRDGTHAEWIAVPVASLRRKPKSLDFAQAASVGVNFMAAWCGLVEAADLRAGETLVIIGAGGGVGGAAAQIGARIGARIIGVDRGDPHPEAAIRKHADTLIVGEADVPAAVRAATDNLGADVVYDAVGGVMFRSALGCLARQGRLIEISATGQREVSFDIADFYHNESRLFGIDTLKHDLVASAKILEALTPGFDCGDYQPAPIAETVKLVDAQAAYAKVAGGSTDRIVLTPHA